GLAVHPASGEIYVLSGVRKALVVLSPEGERVTAVSLPPGLYPQPEGIAFAADGTLYIANEGGDGAATLLRLSPTPLP
ncbi:MAG: SdiA-regulated domain-containing protein, partial [Bacteroidota bacterium]